MFAVEFIGNSGLPERKEFDSRDQAVGFADSLHCHARVFHKCVLGGENWELALHGYH